jgi:surfeit locus 1 family protein
MHHLLSFGWIIKHSFALIIVVSCIWLGFWQIDRLGQRRAENAARLAALERNPITIIGVDLAPEEIAGRPVRVSGTLLNDQSIVLRNQRSNSGVNGLHLLTPLRIAGSERAVLIDRGWIPGEQVKPINRPDYTITSTLEITGLAQLGRSRPEAMLAPYDLPLPGESRIEAWIRVDITKIQQQVDADLLPFYIEQLPAGPSAPAEHTGHGGGPPASQPEIRDPTLVDDGPHLGYAIQWFIFAGIIIIGYTALMRQELRKPT